MIVAVHQPNYLPWLGYFAKMARADVFVLLDDVQFSKGSYTNRVQIARGGAAHWLTLPIRHDFGAAISDIGLAREDWARAHRDTLRQAYAKAAHFKVVWPEIEHWLGEARGGLAAVNGLLVRAVAKRLGLRPRIVVSSDLGIAATSSDERLVAIVASLAPGGTYLSGAGGANYQSEALFRERGLSLVYSSFKPHPYARSGEPFLPGLSIVDAALHLGWDETATLIRPAE